MSNVQILVLVSAVLFITAASLMLAMMKPAAKAAVKPAAQPAAPAATAQRILVSTRPALLQDESPELANWFAQWPDRHAKWQVKPGLEVGEGVFSTASAWHLPALRAHFIRLSTGIAVDVMTTIRRQDGWK